MRLLKLNADPFRNLCALTLRVHPQHAHLALEGPAQSHDRLDSTRLAGPIGAHDAENLALPHLK